MGKRQAIMRHLSIHQLIINRFVKYVRYRASEHFVLFKQIVSFLFMFCYDHPINQLELLPHLNYLLTLIDRDIKVPKLIA